MKSGYWEIIDERGWRRRQASQRLCTFDLAQLLSFSRRQASIIKIWHFAVLKSISRQAKTLSCFLNCDFINGAEMLSTQWQ